MSRDLLFWRRGPKVRLTPGAIFLALGEYPIEGLEAIDEVSVIQAIDSRFPGWQGEQVDRWVFECDVVSTFVTLRVFASTPPEVEAWFRDFAMQEGLDFFDHETDQITEADRATHRWMSAAAKRDLQREEEQDLGEEFPLVLSRAEAGDIDAQFALGQRLSFGDGVKEDHAEAASWYERAANAGNVDAMVNLAALHRSGKGVPRDLSKALAWLERALPGDGLIAAFELAQMHAAREGVPVNPARAESLFRMALANGHPEARKALRLLSETR
jgi:hypothetical protein